jgi:hypothetical protein
MYGDYFLGLESTSQADVFAAAFALCTDTTLEQTTIKANSAAATRFRPFTI